MFTWLLSWLPVVNFSTFILINTVVILVNASTILVIKYTGSRFWSQCDELVRDKQKSTAKKKSKGTLRKSSPKSKKRSPKKTSTGDKEGKKRPKNTKNEDESINTTLDEITWVSSNVDDTDTAYQENKLTLQRQNRSSQQKSKRMNSMSQNVGSTKKSRHLLQPIEEGDERIRFNQNETDYGVRQTSQPLCSSYNPDTTKQVQNVPIHPVEKRTSTAGKTQRKTDHCSDALWHQNSKQVRANDDPCDKFKNLSPKEKPPTPKSGQSSGWSSNVSNTKCDLCASEYPSLSSENLARSNKSEISANLNRDSWIWFSSHCTTNAGNFAARQDTFRSTDPRVPKLLAEITRQDQMNEDIQREANSLISTEPSKLSPHNKIKEIWKSNTNEKQFQGYPVMRHADNSYIDKSIPEMDIDVDMSDKEQHLGHTRRRNVVNQPNLSHKSPSPSYKYGCSSGTARGKISGIIDEIPTYRPHVQFIAPKISQSRRANIGQEPPQKFTSITYNHRGIKHSQSFKCSPNSRKTNKRNPEADFVPQKGFEYPDRALYKPQLGLCSYDIKPSASCLFPLITYNKSPSTSYSSSPKRCILADEEKSVQNTSDLVEQQTLHQEQSCSQDYCHSTHQPREESESDSLFVNTTSLETYGYKTNQIGQEVSRAIKNIIFNNDSHSSTSNSKLASSLQSKHSQQTADVQATSLSPSKRKRKGAMTKPESPESKPKKIDRKVIRTNSQSPVSKPRKYDRHDEWPDESNKKDTPRSKDKQRKYVFGSNYYLSTRSQSQLRLSLSKSCTSNEATYTSSCNLRNENKTKGSRSANQCCFGRYQSRTNMHSNRKNRS